MNQYFLPKVGWKFFDISRAYGLGILVHVLTEDAELTDMGGVYLIKTSGKPDFGKIDDIFTYFGSDYDWKITLITIQRSTRTELKKKVIEARNKVMEFFKDSNKIKELLRKLSLIHI